MGKPVKVVNVEFEESNTEPMTIEYGPDAPGVGARFGRGLMSAAEGVKQFGLDVGEYAGMVEPGTSDAYTQRVMAERDLYRKSKEASGMTGPDPIEFAGEVAPWLAVGGASMVRAAPKAVSTAPWWARIAKTGAAAAAGGATAGATQFVEPGGSRALNTAVAAGVGTAAPVVVKGASKGVEWAGKKGIRYLVDPARRLTYGLRASLDGTTTAAKVAESVDPVLKKYGLPGWEKLSAEAQDAARAEAANYIGKTGKVSPEAAARRAVMTELGFVDEAAPTTAQLARDPKLWTAESDLSKLHVGSAIKDRYVNQGRRWFRLQNEMGEAIGGQGSSKAEAARKVMEAVEAQWRKSQEAVGRLYDSVRASGKGGEPVALTRAFGLVDDLTKNQEDNLVRGLPTLRTMLANEGDNTVLRSVDRVEVLRKKANQLLGGSTDPYERKVYRSFIDALDDDVTMSVGDDAYKAARQAARTRFQAFEDDLLDTIIKKDPSEDKFFNRYILNGDTKQVETLKNTLESPVALLEGADKEASKAAGKEAWEAVRGQTWEWLVDKSMMIRDDAARFNPTAFKRAMDQLGDRAKLIFTADELGKINKLGKAGEWLFSEPLFSDVNHSNTGRFLVDYINKATVMARVSPQSLPAALAVAGPKAAAEVAAGRAASDLLAGAAPAETEAKLGEWLGRKARDASFGGGAALGDPTTTRAFSDWFARRFLKGKKDQ